MKALLILVPAALPLVLTSCYTTGHPYGGGYAPPFHNAPPYTQHHAPQPAHYDGYRPAYRSSTHYGATPFSGHTDTHSAVRRSGRYEEPRHRTSTRGHDPAGQRTDSRGHHVDKHGHEKDPENGHH